MLETNNISLQINNLTLRSRANGKGVRTVIWTQGCNLRCSGCFNPKLWKFEGGRSLTPQELSEMIPSDVEGITISGGEPLLQDDLLPFLIQFRRLKPKLNIILLTGFTPVEKEDDFHWIEFLGLVDVIVSGRYQEENHIGEGIRGSSNKEYIFLSDEFSKQDFENLPQTEVITQEDGSLLVTGMVNSEELTQALRELGVDNISSL